MDTEVRRTLVDMVNRSIDKRSDLYTSIKIGGSSIHISGIPINICEIDKDKDDIRIEYERDNILIDLENQGWETAKIEGSEGNEIYFSSGDVEISISTDEPF